MFFTETTQQRELEVIRKLIVGCIKRVVQLLTSCGTSSLVAAETGYGTVISRLIVRMNNKIT